MIKLRDEAGVILKILPEEKSGEEEHPTGEEATSDASKHEEDGGVCDPSESELQTELELAQVRIGELET